MTIDARTQAIADLKNAMEAQERALVSLIDDGPATEHIYVIVWHDTPLKLESCAHGDRIGLIGASIYSSPCKAHMENEAKRFARLLPAGETQPVTMTAYAALTRIRRANAELLASIPQL